MKGSIRSLVRRFPTFPPSALARTEGFLFVAAMVAGASGAPWLDRLGIDPVWLMTDPSDSLSSSRPRCGLSMTTRSDLALREPLRLDWGGTEFVQTLSADLQTEQGVMTPWIQTVRTSASRGIATSTISVDHPRRDQGLRGGAWFGGSWLEARFESGLEPDRQYLSGSIRVARSGSWLETGASRSDAKSRLEFRLPEGDLDLDWRDRTDSLGVSIGASVGRTRGQAKVWRRESRAPQTEGLVDTGRAAGWDLRLEVATEWGVWKAGVARDRSELHTIGVVDGRSFHDKNWQSEREAVSLGWERGSWAVAAGARRLRVELVVGGIDQAFVDWNMVPLDAFTRVGAVLESRSEYLAGTLEVARSSFLVSRSWNGPRSHFSMGCGGSWTEFDGRLDRTTLEARGLFPYLTDDVPFDGSGWIAMGELRVREAWTLGSLGSLVAKGSWHQPLAGRSRSASGSGKPSSPAPSGKNEKSPVDPLGFHQASLEWMLAW